MIYLVSNQKELFENTEYSNISPEDAINMLKSIKRNDQNKRIIASDTETTGLNFIQNNIITIQLGNKDFQIVWDCITTNISLLKDILEDEDTITVWWNSIFDLLFLYKNNIFPRNIYDGILAEQLLYNGLDYKNLLTKTIEFFGSGYTPFALKTAVKRYCNENLDKSVRGKIIKSGLTKETIIYAARDIEFEIPVMEEQMKRINSQGLDKALFIENQFAPCLAYFKFCGVKLDIPRWRKKMSRDIAEMIKYKDQLDKWVIDYFNSFNGENGKIKLDIRVGKNVNGRYENLQINIPQNANLITGRQEVVYEDNMRVVYDIGKYEIPFGYYEGKEFRPFVYQNIEGDLFEGFDPDQHCSINWNSPSQIIPLFEFLGFNLDIIDKKTKQKRKSVSSETIQKQKDISSISGPYINYKAAANICQSYGQKWIDMVDSDGRIHPDYYQLGTNTTRVSSGNPDDPDSISILTLPKDYETRACFIAEEGNLFISQDYSAEEAKILADVSKDKAMINFFNNGCNDIHSLIASKAYKDIIGDCPIEEINKRFPNERQGAKKLGYTINYNGNAKTIHDNDPSISMEEAEELYNNYMESFPGIKAYQDYCKQSVFKDGYILICPQTGHKAYFDYIDKLIEIQQMMRQKNFWEKYKFEKRNYPDSEYVKNVKFFYKTKTQYEIAATNYRIQGRGAVIFKLSMIYFWNYIINNNLINIVKLLIPPYDECNIECPEEMADKISKVLQKCMEKGASIICKQVKISTDINIGKHWIH